MKIFLKLSLLSISPVLLSELCAFFLNSSNCDGNNNLGQTITLCYSQPSCSPIHVLYASILLLLSIMQTWHLQSKYID